MENPITRRQLPRLRTIDHKAKQLTQSDRGHTPSGELTPFNAYVALSRSRGRDSIRLLRYYDERLFTTHPNEHLTVTHYLACKVS